VSDRFPRYVYGTGTEPDPRFTFANERTFLAWIRTSLALLAGGVALEAFDLPLRAGLRLAASLLLITVALVTSVGAWWQWSAAERALRAGRPLPSSWLVIPLTTGVAAVSVIVLLAAIRP